MYTYIGYIHIYIYIYIYLFIYFFIPACLASMAASVRGMGGAPRNPAPRSLLFVRIVKPSGYRCADALGGSGDPSQEHFPLLSDSGFAPLVILSLLLSLLSSLLLVFVLYI